VGQGLGYGRGNRDSRQPQGDVVALETEELDQGSQSEGFLGEKSQVSS
jgi:hypothetical protein